MEPDSVVYANWLWDGEYITTEKGTLLEGDDYLVDSNGKVYVYDFELDVGVELSGAMAHSKSGCPYRFDEENAEPIYVLFSDSVKGFAHDWEEGATS